MDEHDWMKQGETNGGGYLYLSVKHGRRHWRCTSIDLPPMSWSVGYPTKGEAIEVWRRAHDYYYGGTR